ncbi:MAG: UDP-N-acetylmuramate dehydrogenase [Candidatus Moraniibacteriota bacterium]|nr:MAG: UDP-N-acetylmuramate dehydrogenase [Candidatus Moranbacteria bacterium]
MMTPQEYVDLHPLTTFRVGGKARYFVEAKTEEDICEALRWAKDRSTKVFVLGGGSNVLFSDSGWDGLVIKIELCDLADMGEGRLRVGAGTLLHSAVECAKDHGYGGIERLAGIPGTIGGAVRGNAGAFGAETASAVTSVRALDRETFRVREYSREECEFSYRMSIFKKHPELVVLSAVLSLAPGQSPDDLEKTMRETIATRETKHPQRLLCAGSFFMNPVVSDASLRREFELDTGMPVKDDKLPAGWVIDHVGLRGKEVGGAKVSDIHPNYIINTGTATAESILILTSIIKQKVRTEANVRLREEVQMVGF